MRNFFILAVKAFLFACLVSAGDSRLPAEPPADPPKVSSAVIGGTFGSMYCGPRCVQRVLHEYGISAETGDLIREVQWPAVEDGSTIVALTEALKRRGIFSRVVNVDKKFKISWNHPAIVHLESNGKSHFVVWLPPLDPHSEGRVWDHDLSEAVLHKEKKGFERFRSGPVLLTSDKPISDSAIAGKANSPGGWTTMDRVVCLTLMSVAFLLGAAFHR